MPNLLNLLHDILSSLGALDYGFFFRICDRLTWDSRRWFIGNEFDFKNESRAWCDSSWYATLAIG